MTAPQGSADLSDAQFERYARHLILDEIGEEGQQRLLQARVLVVGAGGLGAPLLLYLAAAGIGTLGVVDDDVVELSNLQRQIIHGAADVSRPKIDSAKARIEAIDPAIRVEAWGERLYPGNADRLVAGYDLIADGSDNFDTRYLLNDACIRAGKTLVSASVTRFEGQLATFKSHEGAPHPCYRCIFPEAPDPDAVPRCVEAGILGAVAGVMGSLQATEVIKEILNIGESLSGGLLMYDALQSSFYKIRVPRDPNCPSCGNSRHSK